MKTCDVVDHRHQGRREGPKVFPFPESDLLKWARCRPGVSIYAPGPQSMLSLNVCMISPEFGEVT